MFAWISPWFPLHLSHCVPLCAPLCLLHNPKCSSLASRAHFTLSCHLLLPLSFPSSPYSVPVWHLTPDNESQIYLRPEETTIIMIMLKMRKQGNWNPLSTFKNKARLVTAWPSRIVNIYRDLSIYIYVWDGTLCQLRELLQFQLVKLFKCTHTHTHTQSVRAKNKTKSQEKKEITHEKYLENAISST